MSRMKKSRYFFSGLASLIAVAFTLSWVGKAIILGEPVSQGEFPETFAFRARITQDGSSFEINCTATLIHPRVMVTAAHCVNDGAVPLYALNGPSALGSNGGAIENETNPDHGFVVKIDRGVPHPDFRERGGGYYHTVGGDVGYLVLSEPVSPEVAKPAKIKIIETYWGRRRLVGKDMTLVGYGATNDTDIQDLYRTMGIKRKGTVTVTYARSTYLNASGMTGQSPLEGDSGGSAFMTDPETGERLLVAVIAGQMDTRAARYYSQTYRRIGNFPLLTREKLCWIENDSGIDLEQIDCSKEAAALALAKEKAAQKAAYDASRSQTGRMKPVEKPVVREKPVTAEKPKTPAKPSPKPPVQKPTKKPSSKPSVKKPEGEKPASEKPAVEKPAAKKPVSKKPSTKKTIQKKVAPVKKKISKKLKRLF